MVASSDAYLALVTPHAEGFQVQPLVRQPNRTKEHSVRLCVLQSELKQTKRMKKNVQKSTTKRFQLDQLMSEGEVTVIRERDGEHFQLTMEFGEKTVEKKDAARSEFDMGASTNTIIYHKQPVPQSSRFVEQAEEKITTKANERATHQISGTSSDSSISSE
eukprot:TRINITY_DN53059_c0_g1_i1.p1 TRINITY_DN53059_c0_g1~~TRINITY_DN53059_c0_g1_i1.p1  ORF type:complete len:176 (+),score=29.72 TRINITY_DN53059_c0_g1_i1:47-529(+)